MKAIQTIASILMLSFSYLTYSGELEVDVSNSKPVSNLVDELFGD